VGHIKHYLDLHQELLWQIMKKSIKQLKRS